MFGEVIAGQDVVIDMEAVRVKAGDKKPEEDVVIVDCGELSDYVPADAPLQSGHSHGGVACSGEH